MNTVMYSDRRMVRGYALSSTLLYKINYTVEHYNHRNTLLNTPLFSARYTRPLLLILHLIHHHHHHHQELFRHPWRPAMPLPFVRRNKTKHGYPAASSSRESPEKRVLQCRDLGVTTGEGGGCRLREGELIRRAEDAVRASPPSSFA